MVKRHLLPLLSFISFAGLLFSVFVTWCRMSRVGKARHDAPREIASRAHSIDDT